MSLQGIQSIMDALKVAADLRTEGGENNEYDRALCNFIADYFGTNAGSAEIAEILGMTWHLASASTPLDTEALTIAILFDGPPGPKAGRFIDIMDPSTGFGIKWGDWNDRGDGTWSLIGPVIIVQSEQDRSYEGQGDL